MNISNEEIKMKRKSIENMVHVLCRERSKLNNRIEELETELSICINFEELTKSNQEEEEMGTVKGGQLVYI